MELTGRIGKTPLNFALGKLRPHSRSEKPTTTQKKDLPKEKLEISFEPSPKPQVEDASFSDYAPRAEAKTTEQQTGSPSKSPPIFDLTGVSYSEGPNGTLVAGMGNSHFKISTIGATELSNVEEATYLTVNYLDSDSTKEKGHAALMATDLNTCMVQSGKATAGSWMGALGGLGGGLLVAHGLTRVVKGAGVVEKLEGVADTNWGAQTAMPGISKIAELGSWASTATKTLGVVGGVIQAGLGAKKVVEGVGSKDVEQTAIGGAEVLAGGSWMLASLAVAPGITIPAFLVLTIGSKAYQHREQLKNLADTGAQKIKKVYQGIVPGTDHFPNAVPAS